MAETDTYTITPDDENAWQWLMMGPMQGAISNKSIREAIEKARLAEERQDDGPPPPSSPRRRLGGEALGLGY